MYLWLLNTHPNNLYNAVKKKNNNRGYTHTAINAPKHFIILSFCFDPSRSDQEQNDKTYLSMIGTAEIHIVPIWVEIYILLYCGIVLRNSEYSVYQDRFFHISYSFLKFVISLGCIEQNKQKIVYEIHVKKMWVFKQLHIVNDCQKINVVSVKSSKELFMIIVSSKTCPSLSVFFVSSVNIVRISFFKM